MSRPAEGLEPTLLILLVAGAVVFLFTAFLASRTASVLKARKAALTRGAGTFALALAGIFLALIVLEVLFRLFIPGGYFAFIPVKATDPEAVVERLPDGRTWWEYRDTKGFDSKGYRGSFEPLDPDSLHLVVLGDSVTYGPGVDYSQTFAYLVRQGLEKKCGKVSLYNLAVPGYSTFQERVALERKGLCVKPDVVLLGVFPNDEAEYTIIGNAAYDIRIKEKDGVPIFSFLPIPDSVNKFLVMNSVLYQFLTLRGVRAFDAVSGNLSEKLQPSVRELERIRRLTVDAGARLVVTLLPMLDQDLSLPMEEEPRVFYEAIQRWAQDAGVTVIDPKQELSKYDFHKLSVDRCCHLSALGHRVVAETILKGIERELPGICK